MRPYWTGQIRVSLVSFGIEIFSALDRGAKLQMHKIHEPTGKRIHYQNIIRDGEQPVSREEIVKGYEYDRGKYLLLEPEELEEIQLESKRSIDIVQFVGLHEIPDLYIDRPYYVRPEEGEVAREAYQVIFQALSKQKKVGLGQMYRGGREYLVALKPCHGGLLLETLRYENEVREASRFYEGLQGKADKDKLELAEALIAKKTAPFDPSKFTDHYHLALQELIEAKLEQREPHIAEESESKQTVVNLMDALKKSVEGKKKKSKKSAA